MVTFDCHSNIVYSDIEGCAFKPMAKLGFQISKLTLIGCLFAVCWLFINKIFLKKQKTVEKTPPDLRTYHIPNAHPDEFLIEKSPQYARGTRESLRNNAIRMLEANPKMKLFAFISGL